MKVTHCLLFTYFQHFYQITLCPLRSAEVIYRSSTRVHSRTLLLLNFLHPWQLMRQRRGTFRGNTADVKWKETSCHACLTWRLLHTSAAKFQFCGLRHMHTHADTHTNTQCPSRMLLIKMWTGAAGSLPSSFDNDTSTEEFYHLFFCRRHV